MKWVELLFVLLATSNFITVFRLDALRKRFDKLMRVAEKQNEINEKMVEVLSCMNKHDVKEEE